MPRTKPIKGGKPPPLPARSGQFKATNRTSRVQLGVVSPVHLARMTFLPIAVLLAPILPFAISSMARDWMLGALGYGLIPVYLWMVGFILALRYRRAWIGLHWRGWVGAALLVAISLGIISMFDASSGVMEDASLGGYWGGYLGGSPVPFGALKVAFLVLVAPLLLYPRPAVALYRRWAWKFLSAIGLSLNWLLQRLAHSLRNLRARRPYPQQPTEPKTGVIIPDDEMSEHLEPAPVAQFSGVPKAGLVAHPGPAAQRRKKVPRLAAAFHRSAEPGGEPAGLPGGFSSRCRSTSRKSWRSTGWRLPLRISGPGPGSSGSGWCRAGSKSIASPREPGPSPTAAPR